MKKISPVAYKSLFLKHSEKFLRAVATLRELEESHAVAVSGGLDSMTLLWFAHHLSIEGIIGPVRAIFIHHKTRSGQDEDQKVVEKFCREEGISLTVLEAEGLSTGANFEGRARKIRRELLLNELSQGELLWLGHHLNDSYEWAIMQRNRSSRIKTTLGIPVRNGRIIRPFLCVSRKQIERVAKFEGIPFREDPTNNDLRYDRNFVRKKIVANIAKRYPKYLKHYVNISNGAAMNMNQNILRKGSLTEVYVYEDGAVLVGQRFDVIQIQELMHSYSSADRGELVGPIGRMLDAIRNGKKGPFQFSGGLEAYHSHHLLMIYRKGMKNSDHSIAELLRSLSTNVLENIASYSRPELENSFRHSLNNPHAMCDMPGLVLVLENNNICKTLNTSVFDVRFPEVSRVCQERGLRFLTFTKCLERWKSHRKNLPERLHLLPLSNLSNLFSSQQ
ncbi:MAG: tRNA lysidine(34) synthetase TilS [Bacteriovoracaceae bacterium]